MFRREDRELDSTQTIKKWLQSLGMTGWRAPAEKDQIHLLVTVPRYQILDRQVVAVDYGARWRESSSMAPSSEFKASLTRAYSCDMGAGKLRCMLLNEAFPPQLVVAFHLFHRNKPDILHKFMGFDDVDDVGNGLVLFKPLMFLFDDYRVSFIYDEASDQFRLKVFDKSLVGERLFGRLSPEQREILLGGSTLPQDWEDGGERVVPGTGFNIQTTFKDVDGRALPFGPTLQRPYKRCLCLQAHVARKIAVKMEWIQPDEDAFEDFREEGMSLTEKMRVFHTDCSSSLTSSSASSATALPHGDSNSAELESPMQEPQGPMKALDGSLIAKQPTNLRVKASSLQTRATVTNLGTNTTIGLFKGKMFSSRVVLETPQGRTIASITNKTFSSKYRVFQGDEIESDPSFMIQDVSSFFKTMVLVAEFTDKETGTPCRIMVRGSPSTKVVLFYLARGSPTLSQLQGSDDFLENQDRYQRVARIRRKSYFGGDDYFIEASAGVDLTLLLLVWHVRHTCLVAERANANS